MKSIIGCIGAVALIALGAGAQPAAAQTLSRAEFDRLTASAKTAADHKALAAHYRAHADEHAADAAAHERIALEARARRNDDDAWDLARDASHYAEHSREAAEALRELAALHEGVAERAAGSKGGCCSKPASAGTVTAPAGSVASPATDSAAAGGGEHKH